MHKLSICIPNYNRKAELYRLVKESASQIMQGNLAEEVEICISDDCSVEKPDDIVHKLQDEYPGVEICYRSNEKNLGMDHNFLQSVFMAHGEYCWIIGNDDVPEGAGIPKAYDLIKDSQIDILVSPFHVYDQSGKLIKTNIPIVLAEDQSMVVFDTRKEEEYRELLQSVNNCNALFGFLSNTIFRRAAWLQHGDRFEDKMGTIFIQMYMNIQTVLDGALYAYTNEKLIRNHLDTHTNATFKRGFDVVTGLNGVMTYFFSGKQLEIMLEKVVDPFLSGSLWEHRMDLNYIDAFQKLQTPKSHLYEKFYIDRKARADFFQKKSVCVYGAGLMGKKAIEELKSYAVREIRLFDADMEKSGQRLQDIEIYPAYELWQKYQGKYDVVVVANQRDTVKIVNKLHKEGIGNIVFMT